MSDAMISSRTSLGTAAAGAALSLLLCSHQYRALPLISNVFEKFGNESSDTYSAVRVTSVSFENDIVLLQLNRIYEYLMTHEVELDLEAHQALRSKAWELYL